MAEPPESGTPAEGASTALEGGAYDLIKQRLSDQAKVLAAVGFEAAAGTTGNPPPTVFDAAAAVPSSSPIGIRSSSSRSMRRASGMNDMTTT